MAIGIIVFSRGRWATKGWDGVQCRKCGACCIAISISSPVAGMPGGKPAGVPCIHLTADYLCRLFGNPARPDVCDRFQPAPETCGGSREEAMLLMAELEATTDPDP